jgi:hypothetical protein
LQQRQRVCSVRNSLLHARGFLEHLIELKRMGVLDGVRRVVEIGSQQLAALERHVVPARQQLAAQAVERRNAAIDARSP